MINTITHTLDNAPILITRMACIKSDAINSDLDITMSTDVSNKIDALYNGVSDEDTFLAEYNDESCRCEMSTSQYDHTCMSFVFNIYCTEPIDITLTAYHTYSRCSFWLNKKYIGMSICHDIILLHLQRGNNCCCFSFFRHPRNLYMQIRISKLEYELNNGFASLVSGNMMEDLGSVGLLDFEYTWRNQGVYRGVLYSLNHVEIDVSQTVVLKILSYYSTEPIMVFHIKFYEQFEIDLSKIKLFDDERLNYFKIRIEYQYKDGRCGNIERFFSFDELETMKIKLRAETQALINNPNISSVMKNNLEHKMMHADNITDESSSAIVVVTYTAKSLLEGIKIDINQALEDISLGRVYHPRRNQIFYHSNLDNSIYHYEVYLPEDYDGTKAYPLVINHTSSEIVDYTSILMRKNYESDVIIANVTTRGVTVGSYIGEASINEVLSDIRSRFLIDESHVSATGFSSGAAATWLQAELAPHRYAAIASFVGYLHPDLIKNLTNLKVLDAESEFDRYFWQTAMDHSEDFSAIDGYSLIDIKYFDHQCMGMLRLNTNIVDYLSKCTIDNYPNEIRFRAIYNRHLRAYWLTIHSIEDTSEYGDIEAYIIGDDTIKIDCLHITGFTLEIPPQIKADIINLVVNGQLLVYERVSDKISLVKKSNIDPYEFGEADQSKFKIYHGTGLIDVYLTPISIINLAPDSEEMCESAQQFSSPQTNTIYPQVKVAYPVYTPETLDIESYKHRSLIVLDNNSNHEYAEYLRSLCEIKMDNHGFEYRDTYYDGDYCVMQIITHPHDSERTILYINANNPKLYKRNFFTRQVIIPMYNKVRHPYLNNAALIFYNNQYHTVFEYGCEICGGKPR